MYFLLEASSLWHLKKNVFKVLKKKKKQSISKGKEEKKENGIVEGTSKGPKVQSNV